MTPAIPSVAERLAATQDERLTPAQEKRLTAMFAGIAREPVTVEKIKATYYVFGSELACLRIFAKYHANGAVDNPKARMGHSPTRNSWYFVLEN